MSESSAEAGDSAGIQQRIREIEAEIARLRGDQDGIEDSLGDDAGPRDAEDTAAADTNLEENEAVIAALEDRHAALLDQLSGKG